MSELEAALQAASRNGIRSEWLSEDGRSFKVTAMAELFRQAFREIAELRAEVAELRNGR